MLKSALTAALSGAPAATQTAPSKQTKTDSWAFPCLAYQAEQEGASVDELTEAIDSIDLKSVSIAGSAATLGPLAEGEFVADYDLDPYHRRGGKEIAPSAGTSVNDKYVLSSSSQSYSQNFISDVLVGSLPKGLTEAERMSIQLNTPLSPSMNLLNELSVDKVGSRSAAGQKLRRHVLRGAAIVFVTAGYSGKRFIFERAKELGVRSIVLDGPDSWVQQLVKEGTIEQFVPIDFSDAESTFDRCYEAITKLRSQLGDLDGVVTFCELAVPLVARLAEKLGLPGNTPSAVDAARDKFQTREALEKAGLPSPKHFLVEKEEDVAKAAKHVGFPCVIKPILGAASIGVIRANDEEQLQAAYAKVVNDMKKARIVAGALVQGGDDDEDAGNAGEVISLLLMVEEYLDGPEVDCDLVFSDGTCVYGAVTDNWPTVEPYFNETGSNCPSILTLQQQRELLDLSVRSVQSLGLRIGVYHVECKYTSRGARLIEVNCRMGGGPVHATNLLVWGVDLAEEHLLTSCGIPSRPQVARRPLVQLSEYSINAHKTGVLQSTNFLGKWQQHPDVLYARYLVAAGQKCVCVEDGLPTWVCELMVTKPSVHEAIDFMKTIEKDIMEALPIH